MDTTHPDHFGKLIELHGDALIADWEAQAKAEDGRPEPEPQVIPLQPPTAQPALGSVRHAEMQLLASMMLGPHGVAEAVDLGLRAEHFTQARDQRLFQVLLSLHDKGVPIDPASLRAAVEAAGGWKVVGSEGYVCDLLADAFTTALIPEHVRIVREGATDRGLVAMIDEVGQRSKAGADMRAVVNWASEQTARLLSQEPQRKTGLTDHLLAVQERLKKQDATPNRMLGLLTGFPDLDQIVGGLEPGELALLAGRTSSGKSACALSIAQNVAMLGVPTRVFSLEMSGLQLSQRMLLGEAGLSIQELRNRGITEADWAKIRAAHARLARMPLDIDDRSALDPATLRAAAERHKALHGLGFVVVDYLQLIDPGKQQNREQAVAYISSSLRKLARDLEVPVLALAQLNRAVEGRPEKRPLLSDLRDSGTQEQDADVVILLYRDEYYNPNTEQKGIAELHVAKNRRGAVGIAKLRFIPELARFMSLAPDWRTPPSTPYR